MITLFVTGLEFYGYHGVPDEEQIIGHRYIVDLEMIVESSAEFTDSVNDTVDYGQASLVIHQIGTQEKYRTVEKLARIICERLLDRFPTIEEVSIRLAKRLPPAAVIAEEAGVELLVSRSGSRSK